jgi:diaminopimelate epimerase
MRASNRRYFRAHGHGNDYLVVDAGFGLPMTAGRARRLCDRNRGIGSDGVLVETAIDGDIGLRIFNPDGSEAEKSGNGLRIFAAWCFSRGGFDPARPLTIDTLGGRTSARLIEIRADSMVLSVSMGRVSYLMRDLPMLDVDGRVAPPDARWVRRALTMGAQVVEATCLSVGNPHAVLLGAPCDEATLHSLGPMAERHTQFPKRTNVQLCEVTDRRRVRALVWERGAGPTLASGSSACAVVAACVENGSVDVDSDVEVVMPGGSLTVRVGRDGTLEQAGPVEPIADGEIADELWRALSVGV